MASSSESLLRRALFEDTGGMYPELITRPDIKVFLPPIGGLTVYICQCFTFLVTIVLTDYIQLGIPHSCRTKVKSLSYVSTMNVSESILHLPEI